MKYENYNLTTRMILPLLGWTRSTFEPYLVNAYVRHKELDKFRKDHLFVLLKWSDHQRYNKLLEVLDKSKFTVSNYELDNEGMYNMYIFSIPEETKEDYDLIMEGRYSEVGKVALNLILQNNEPGTEVDYILRRDDELREKLEEELDIKLPKTVEVYASFKDENVMKREEFSKEKLEELLILN